jgi:hypothetical protein
MSKCDVAIIGAGPYGLSATAFLRTVKGLDVHTFGEPMTFWERNMPAGMLLRSGWVASHISDPNQSLTLDVYRTASANPFSAPVPLSRFIDYGLWFQRQTVPDLDPRKIVRVESVARGFRLTPEAGDSVIARHVVVAAGISPFARRPVEFSGIDNSLASHTSEHRDLRKFSGKQVLVVGSGQSALESAALLYENGAEVEVVARSPQIRWLGGIASRAINTGFGPRITKLLYAPTDVGPAVISQIVARPDIVRRFPAPVRNWFRRRSIRPAGARWLFERVKNVPMRLGHLVKSVAPIGGRIAVRMDNGDTSTFDHVLLGTGYKIEVSRYEFLSPRLAESISTFHGYPRLADGFETSVPGLHIIGAPSIWSFGPLMQFVVGTHYASRSLLRCIATKRMSDGVRLSEQLVAQLG